VVFTSCHASNALNLLVIPKHRLKFKTSLGMRQTHFE